MSSSAVTSAGRAAAAAVVEAVLDDDDDDTAAEQKSGGRGGGGGGGKQGSSAQPLAITDKSEGLSGKSVASKDKHWKEGEAWDLTKVIASLESELGKWEGKSPCPFYHIKGKCSFAPKDCRRFH